MAASYRVPHRFALPSSKASTWARFGPATCCARPGTTGHPAKPQDRRALARPDQVVPSPARAKTRGVGADRSTQRLRASQGFPAFAALVLSDAASWWRAMKGARTKQPYAIAMKDGSPFGVAGYGRTGVILERRVDSYVRDPHRASQRASREIHDRMPSAAYER